MDMDAGSAGLFFKRLFISIMTDFVFGQDFVKIRGLELFGYFQMKRKGASISETRRNMIPEICSQPSQIARAELPPCSARRLLESVNLRIQHQPGVKKI